MIKQKAAYYVSTRRHCSVICKRIKIQCDASFLAYASVQCRNLRPTFIQYRKDYHERALGTYRCKAILSTSVIMSDKKIIKAY